MTDVNDTMRGGIIYGYYAKVCLLKQHNVSKVTIARTADMMRWAGAPTRRSPPSRHHGNRLSWSHPLNLAAESLIGNKANEKLSAHPGVHYFYLDAPIRDCAMSDIDKALEKFVSVCKKYALTGHFETVSDLDNIFPVKLPHSAALDYFYKNYNPEGLKIETGFTPIKLYAVNELEKSQVGYSYFPDNYLVIGDDFGGGKPIIAVVDMENTPVYASYDVSEPFKIADSFADFISSLTNLIDLVYGGYDIFDVADDNDELKEGFIEELRASISPIIGNENFDAFFDYFYG